MRRAVFRRPSIGTMLGLVALLLAATGGVPGLIARGADTHQSAPTTSPATLLPRTIKAAVEEVDIPAESWVGFLATECPARHRLISGGVQITGTITAYALSSFATTIGGHDAWEAVVVNPPGIHFAGKLRVQAICATRGKPVVP